MINDSRVSYPTSTSASSINVKWQILAVMTLVFFVAGLMMHVDTRSTFQVTALQEKNTSIHTHSPTRRSCRELMTRSQFASGEFLTNPALPHAWIPRVDDSREFQHGLCEIHRYTSEEARRCLIGKHLNFIGDSVSRYGALSLAYFLEGKWPPRFGFELPYCRRFDENGTAVCSTEEDPNLTIRGNFLRTRFRTEGTIAQAHFCAKIGGWTDGGIFNGRLECKCAAEIENWMYVTPELDFASKPPDGGNEFANVVVITMNSERGWEQAAPIQGFDFRGCAMTGTCRYNQTDIMYWRERAVSGDLDWTQDLLDFLSADGALASQLPPVDIVMYNRGLWGLLPEERSKKVFPLLYNHSGRAKGQCFYRTTVSAKVRVPEIEYVRDHTLAGQCSFFDFAGIAEDFVDLHSRKDIHRGNENWTLILPQQE
jgi:hypothetical protein